MQIYTFSVLNIVKLDKKTVKLPYLVKTRRISASLAALTNINACISIIKPLMKNVTTRKTQFVFYIKYICVFYILNFFLFFFLFLFFFGVECIF